MNLKHFLEIEVQQYKPKKRKKDSAKLDSKSLDKIKENLDKMEKGFIKGISLSSLVLTPKIYSFIEENNLEIVNGMIRLRRE